MENKLIIGILSILFVAVLFSGCISQYIQPVQNQTFQATNQTEQPALAQQQNLSGLTSISVNNFAFIPGTATIKAGTIVRWTNGDSVPHSIKVGTFTSSTFSKGQSFDYQFNSTGSFDYTCGVHPSMKGKIIVE